jgi:serine/threonine protein kinase/alpha-beta hydrolase superfamily lysophospholipase
VSAATPPDLPGPPSDPNSWRNVRRLFEDLLERTPQERDERLRQHADDPALCAAVLRMLEADERESRASQDSARQPASAAAGPSRLGRYELGALLGSGGMGQVYLARDPELDRSIAVKLLAPGLTRDPRWRARFRQEAKAASAINHPNILTVHEIGSEGERHFIAMEYVRGSSLRARLASGPLPVSECLDIALQMAGALSAAHAVGVVHRDLKPENVMLREDGLVKVLDFGLASTMRGPDPSSRGALTTPGMILGTLAYMATEQARGLDVDAQSDVFSLAVITYEMLVGRTPFDGATPADRIVSILERAPAPLDPELERVLPGIGTCLGRALAKSRSERCESAGEFAAELRRIQERGGRTQQEPAQPPPVRYARSGKVDIAYQVLGQGPIDLVFVMGWVSHLEYFWSEPSFARFLTRLASFARLILFDKRGTGLSDRVPDEQLPTLEQRMDDVRVVMEAVGSERAVLCGVSEGGPMCTLFAATYPERTAALVMIGSYARRLRDDDYPWGPTPEERDRFLEQIRREWGGPVGIETRAPSRAQDRRFRDWWAAYLRHGASPGAAVALTRMNGDIDVRKILPSIRVPTLVVHRTQDQCLKVEEGRHLAQGIPTARFVELPGADHLPFVGDQDPILEAIEVFLRDLQPVALHDSVLATVLIAQAERALTDADTSAVRELHGRITAQQPDGLVATFDGPARAIRAAGRLQQQSAKTGTALRVGLHTGECDVREERVRGLAVDTARRIAGLARPGEVLVSSTVQNLVAGSGLRFAARGRHDFGGELGEMRLFAVERGSL